MPTRISVDVPVPDFDGQWEPETASSFVGTEWPLKVTLPQGVVELPARVVQATVAPDGLTIRLDLETDLPLSGEYRVRDISADDD